jgi:hypothetical protein
MLTTSYTGLGTPRSGLDEDDEVCAHRAGVSTATRDFLSTRYFAL